MSLFRRKTKGTLERGSTYTTLKQKGKGVQMRALAIHPGDRVECFYNKRWYFARVEAIKTAKEVAAEEKEKEREKEAEEKEKGGLKRSTSGSLARKNSKEKVKKEKKEKKKNREQKAHVHNHGKEAVFFAVVFDGLSRMTTVLEQSFVRRSGGRILQGRPTEQKGPLPPPRPKRVRNLQQQFFILGGGKDMCGCERIMKSFCGTIIKFYHAELSSVSASTLINAFFFS